jgi:hypothetical protein
MEFEGEYRKAVCYLDPVGFYQNEQAEEAVTGEGPGYCAFCGRWICEKMNVPIVCGDPRCGAHSKGATEAAKVVRTLLGSAPVPKSGSFTKT